MTETLGRRPMMADAGPDTAALAAKLVRLEDRTGLDPRSNAARAAELGAAATTAGLPAARMRARLIQADAAERLGDRKLAAAVMWQVNEWARTHGDRYLVARSHLLLGRAYRTMGDTAALLEHAAAAVDHLDDTVPAGRRLPYLTRYAEALAETGSMAAARERYRQAAELARGTGARDEITVLNNHAYAEHLAGEPARAWQVVERMRAVAADRGHPLGPDQLDTVATVQIARGHYAEAEKTILDGIAAYPEDALPRFLLTLAVTRRLQGAVTPAQVSLDECRTLCARYGHREILVRVLREQAELYALTGDWHGAYEEFKRYHAAVMDARSAERETQARMRRDLVEVTQARREAELARRDPLTGLRNRRYVDETLPGMIERAVRSGATLWLAVLDLDHFRRINDRCSHEAGDRVLAAVGALLAEAAPDTGFAARLGGDFLLTVGGLGRADTLAFLERVRRAVAGRRWREVTGAVPVTISIGAAAVAAGSTPSTLLAGAVAQLREAKRAGRDRVRMAARGRRS